MEAGSGRPSKSLLNFVQFMEDEEAKNIEETQKKKEAEKGFFRPQKQSQNQKSSQNPI